MEEFLNDFAPYKADDSLILCPFLRLDSSMINAAALSKVSFSVLGKDMMKGLQESGREFSRVHARSSDGTVTPRPNSRT
jgi:hypothetical protein